MVSSDSLNQSGSRRFILPNGQFHEKGNERDEK